MIAFYSSSPPILPAALSHLLRPAETDRGTTVEAEEQKNNTTGDLELDVAADVLLAALEDKDVLMVEEEEKQNDTFDAFIVPSPPPPSFSSFSSVY